MLLWVLNFHLAALAQNDSLYQKIPWKTLVFEKDYLAFNLGTFVMAANTQHQIGEAKINAQSGPGFYCGLNYILALDANFALETGLTYGANPVLFSYLLEAEKYGLIYDRYQNSYNPFDFDANYFGYYSIPLRFISRVQLTESLFGNVKLGINFRHIGFIFTSVGYGGNKCMGCFLNQQINAEIFRMQLELSDHLKPSYEFSLGISKVFKNYDILHINLVYNLSPFTVIEGIYKFFPNEPALSQYYSEGTYSTRGSYLGLEIGYSFTKAGKVLRKIKKEARKGMRAY